MIVGIDLGTTNSLVAVWREGGAQLIPNGLGEVLTPSCVSLDDDGTILVGRAARERLQTHVENSASLFKRHMGSNKTTKLGKREFRAEELSALVLQSLKADAEAFLGHPVTEAVITVPAYFSDGQRKATRAAGKLAGLNVGRLLNEPSAAALAYGVHQMGAESRFLVFDLGGGTFDVSILEMFEGVMEVRASSGDNYLGGEDIVAAMVELFLVRHQLPARLKNNATLMQNLSAQAELCKHRLSTDAESEMRAVIGDKEYELRFDEALLEQVCAPLLKRLRDPVERVLRDANLRSHQLDRVVLAGGATRMPLVRRMVTKMFGRFPECDINPDEVVAIGAAVQAGLKMKDAALEEIVMTDVAPYSLGVNIVVRAGNQYVEGYFDPVIERNSPVPISRVKSYAPTTDGQRSIVLDIYQGEARLVKENVKLGSLTVPLDGGGRDENSVDVRFTYDVNGLLQVEALVHKTQEKFQLLIQDNPGLLSDEEISQRLIGLAKLKIHPRDQLEIRTLLARAERLYQQFRGEQREWLAGQIGRFEQIIATQDTRLVDKHKEEFGVLLDKIERDSYLTPSLDTQE
ncbi:MAG: molecular chaperone HscC [Pseudomonadota bacterium]